MSNDLFLENERYERDYDVVENYVLIQAKSLSLKTGHPMPVAEKWLRAKILKDFAPNDTQMRVLKRDQNQDRVKAKISFLSYLNWVQSTGNILAPNMVSYSNPKYKISYLAQFVSGNLTSRDVIKTEGHAARQAGDLDHAYFCNLEQANKKFFNNSISGSSCSPHNPLYYLTQHSALTSTCRSCTSTANSINERLISSNRHYFSYKITVANIGHVLNKSDMSLIASVVEKYGIEAPSAAFVKLQVYRSTKEYWTNDKDQASINKMIDNMTDLERIAFSFVGDMRALTRTNDNVVRDMFDKLINRSGYESYTEEIFKYATSDIYTLAGMLCFEFMKGKSAKNLKKNEPENYTIYKDTVGNIISTLTEYRDFIQAFYITDVLPASIAELPTSLRAAVVASDTDSSIYSTQELVGWYSGKIDFTGNSVSAGAITAFFSSTCIAHGMFKLSRQIGVSEEEKFRIAMKGEYFFPILLCTQATKHYLYIIQACEGDVYAKNVMEVKGVQLKNSKLPKAVRDMTNEWYERIMTVIIEGTKVTPRQVMAFPAYLEHRITDEIYNGDTTWYRSSSIKSAEVYKNAWSSDWLYSDLWQDVFSDKYGKIAEFPVGCVKLPVNLDKPDKVMAWIDTLEPEIATKFRKWIVKTKREKKGFTQLVLPRILLPEGKVPKEFLNIVDVRKLLSSVTDHTYIVLGIFGIYIKSAKTTRLSSDTVPMEEARESLKFLGINVE